MSFSNPVNIATATMEQIYESLCWVYAALRSTIIFDAIGNSYQRFGSYPIDQRKDSLSRAVLRDD